MDALPFRSQVVNNGPEIRSNVTLVHKLRPLTAFFSVNNYKEIFILLSKTHIRTNQPCLKMVFDENGEITKIESTSVIPNLAVIPVFFDIKIGWTLASPEDVERFHA